MPKQILLADDSVTVRKMVEMTFATEDYQITSVASGDEALAKARSLKPDVMILDCVMPGKDGYEVAQAVKSDAALSSVPCLLLGGNSSPYDDARGQRSGVDAFIAKPFDTQALLDKVAELAASGSKVKLSAAPAPSPVAQRPAIPSTTAPTIDTIQIAPLSAPQGASDDDAIDISLDAPTSARPRTPTPAPTPRVQPFATPAPRPSSIPTPAPIPRPAAIPTPRPAPPMAADRPSVTVPTQLPPQDLTPVPTARASSKVSPLPTRSGPSTMPLQVPQMPRPSLIPNVATPVARATPRATMLGIPTVNPSALGQAAAQAVIAAAAPQGASMGTAPTSGVVPGTNISRNSPEYALLQSMSREVIERIVWEIVPDLAETIIREQLDRLVRERNK